MSDKQALLETAVTSKHRFDIKEIQITGCIHMAYITNVISQKCYISHMSYVTIVTDHKCHISQMSYITNVIYHTCHISQMGLWDEPKGRVAYSTQLDLSSLSTFSKT